MPRPVRGKDVAPTVRGAFLRAVKLLNEESEAGLGPDLTGMILESLKTNLVPTLKAIAAFTPKELMLRPGEGEDHEAEAPIYAIVIPRKEFQPAPALEGEAAETSETSSNDASGESALELWRRRVRPLT